MNALTKQTTQSKGGHNANGGVTTATDAPNRDVSERPAFLPPTIAGTFFERRGVDLRQWVDLSDGRQLLLKWDDAHAYVNVSLHQSDTDERGTDVAYDGAALSVGAVAALVEAFAARVEKERA